VGRQVNPAVLARCRAWSLAMAPLQTSSAGSWDTSSSLRLLVPPSPSTMKDQAPRVGLETRHLVLLVVDRLVRAQRVMARRLAP